MKEYKLPRKTLFLWQFRSIAVTLLLAALCSYFYIRLKPFLIILFIIGILFLFFTFVYLPLFFRSCKIRCSKKGVVVKWGVIIKNTHILPFYRLIYTQTVTTPLSKLLGLKALLLKAARNRLFVPELRLEDAEEILSEFSVGEADE